jgi:hypothetical protein
MKKMLFIVMFVFSFSTYADALSKKVKCTLTEYGKAYIITSQRSSTEEFLDFGKVAINYIYGKRFISIVSVREDGKTEVFLEDKGKNISRPSIKILHSRMMLDLSKDFLLEVSATSEANRNSVAHLECTLVD